ncbi:hypothetical protein [Amycolatopsis sp. CA-126428]|uniref:hypothetical protein n=1 Tax=Amycolatopsis sp. CA-126428 TaxID=2073158 RepID=UPI001E547A43|nr:hypothetical protein [Amycolatopsis sp. CA-126428]
MRPAGFARPLVAMVVAQLTVGAVMTMTPLQLQAHGHGLGVVGWVLSAHMFAGGGYGLVAVVGGVLALLPLAFSAARDGR